MLTAIRRFYRIPQNILAVYLEIGLSHLSMAETGRRKVKNLEALTPFYLATLLEPQTKYKDEQLTAALTSQKQKFETLVYKTLKIKEYKLSCAKKLLDKMKNDQFSALRILRTVPALRAAAA